MTRPWSQDRTVDLAGVAIALLVAVMAAADAEQTGRLTGDALFWALVAAIAGGVALWWRRRAPVVVALAIVPAALVGDLAGGAVLIAVYTVAANRSWGPTLAVAGLHAAAGIPYAVVRPDPLLGVAGSIGLALGLLALVTAIGVAVRRRRRRLAELRRAAAWAEVDAEAEAERLRARERDRIAREMHDVLGHRISLVSLHAGALEIRTDLSGEEVARAAGTIRASAHQALEELRDILGVLRGESGDLAPRPGLAELDQLVAEHRAAGADIELDRCLPDAPLPAAIGRTAYRVILEGLTNAGRHASGAPVRVRLDGAAGGELHVWLRNPLGTRPGPAHRGAGLVGLAERVRLAGGRIDSGVRRDAEGRLAFDLEAWLPWPS